MPYEAISEEEYKNLTAQLRKLDFTRQRSRPREADSERVEEVPDKFCETDACTTVVGEVTPQLRAVGFYRVPVGVYLAFSHKYMFAESGCFYGEESPTISLLLQQIVHLHKNAYRYP